MAENLLSNLLETKLSSFKVKVNILKKRGEYNDIMARLEQVQTELEILRGGKAEREEELRIQVNACQQQTRTGCNSAIVGCS